MEAGGGADFVQCEAGGRGGFGFGEAVGERVGECGVEHAAEQARAEAADAEAGGLFAGEHQEFDGAAGLEAGLLERAHGFEAAEHADGAVVHAGVGDGVGVRAGADGGEVGVGALPADEGVADGIFADGESGFGGEGLEPGAGFEVAWREDDAGDGLGGLGERGVLGRRAVGDAGEVVELAEEAGLVDDGVEGEVHGVQAG